MEYYPSNYQGISNSKTVNKAGAYALDAYQNNPDEEGTLAYQIKRIEAEMEMIREFYTVRAFRWTSDKEGFVKIATIKVLDSYSNAPIMFEVSGRGWLMPAQLFIRFTNDPLTNTGISIFKYTGQIGTDVALCKLDTLTWGLYVKKSERYDNICLHRYNYNYLFQKFDITFPNDFTESLPADAVHPTLYQ